MNGNDDRPDGDWHTGWVVKWWGAYPENKTGKKKIGTELYRPTLAAALDAARAQLDALPSGLADGVVEVRIEREDL